MNGDLQARVGEVRALDARLTQMRAEGVSLVVWGTVMVEALEKAQAAAAELLRLAGESVGGEAGAELYAAQEELRGLVSKWQGMAKNLVSPGGGK